MPGARVRVRFSGRLVDGYVLDRVEASEHQGRLAFLARALSPEPVLPPELAALARTVADRYSGTLADVLRLSVPPRHARVEGETPKKVEQRPPGEPAADWDRYQDGPAYVAALREGGNPRAVWTALPGPAWPDEVAAAVAATADSGRGAVVVVPDARDLARVDEALGKALGAGRHVTVAADLGPAERYRRWLTASRGQVQVVAGTRSAAFAPVPDIGLVVCWDDGDDLHAEPHAPYPHVREVLALRAHLAGCGALFGGYVRTAEGQALIRSGWAKPVAATRATARAAAPRIQPTGADDPEERGARLPTVAWSTARAALTEGPVLVQVPRRGYAPALACARCRAPARCRNCAGPLGLPGSPTDATPACRWCGRPAAAYTCPECGNQQLRAVVVGARRTAEELGRVFPGVPVRTSGRDGVIDRVTGAPALVVATPGAEPVAVGGYPAALLLDGWALLGRPDLRAGEEALRRWANAAALVRPAGEGGRVVLMAEAALRPVQALLRWDPAWHAETELAERVELGFPPAIRMAALTGTPDALRELLHETDLPGDAQVLGPVPGQRPGEERLLVRVPRREGAVLATALKVGQAARSARKAADTVRVEIDPAELG